jgi:hypothetical protein
MPFSGTSSCTKETDTHVLFLGLAEQCKTLSEPVMSHLPYDQERLDESLDAWLLHAWDERLIHNNRHMKK